MLQPRRDHAVGAFGPRRKIPAMKKDADAAAKRRGEWALARAANF
jgi:hypothetical protein